MPILSGRFGRKSRRTQSSLPEHDWAALPNSRPTPTTPALDLPPNRSPSPPLSEQLPSYSSRTSTPFNLDEIHHLLTDDIANLGIYDEAYNPDMPSPNDMLVDTEEHIVEPTENGLEKDNLTIINPDSLETETEQPQDLPRADDCMLLKVWQR